jgi:hypothetical protein
MKKNLTAILLISAVVQLLGPGLTSAQQRSLPPDKTIASSVPGTVTLTRTDYDHLVELGAHRPKPPEAAPVPFVLSNAAFNLRIDNESVAGSADIEGDVLVKGPAIVPLMNGLTILEASQSQGSLPLLQQGAMHSAILEGPGRFSVSLKVASAITVDAGRASFLVPTPSAGSTLLTLDMPGNHVNVKVEPGLITKRLESRGRTTIEATLESGRPAKVWWTTRDVAAPAAAREAHFLSDIKTMISVGDSQLRITALCDVTVIQGEPAEFQVPLPAGYEVAEVSGSTLDSSETRAGVLVLKVREPARRTHQFLIAIERASQQTKLDAPFLSFDGSQRETGETLVEGAGTMELTATEGGGLRRIDVTEAGAIARSLARFPLQAAFRYHRQAGQSPTLQLEWKQFPESAVLSAVAERATVTTLTNVEGKSLTEEILRVRNHAQPFVKIELPKGATILSAEVDGERVKPVEASDGSRVPLLRAGRSPASAYTVSFVYLNSGAAFVKSGSYELSLPKLDLPVDILTWEVLLPERLEVKQFGGNTFPAALAATTTDNSAADADNLSDDELSAVAGNDLRMGKVGPGQIGGTVVDPSGAVVPGAKVKVVKAETGATRSTVTDADGSWAISGVHPGAVRATFESSGFKTQVFELDFQPTPQPVLLDAVLQPGTMSETVTVTASGQNTLSVNGTRARSNQFEIRGAESKSAQPAQLNAPSQNVANLQRRVSGILPVRVDIPRGGKSYRFVRPLVLNEETKLTFQYKSK